MARGRKKASFSNTVECTPESFERFIRTVSASAQKCADANMANAGAWKQAEPQGIHPAAAKLFQRLDRMDGLKRADFLRAFDQYRSWSRWNVQPDLVEAIEEAQERGDGEQTVGEVTFSDGVTATVTIGPEKSEAPDADWDGVVAPEDQEELDTAGYTFGAGEQAGATGAQAEDNPHSNGSPSHVLWEKGRVKGAAARAAAASVVKGDGTIPFSPRLVS